jgi:DNA-binding transcriptional MerR regulator
VRRFTISDIENLTGIKAHTIRIWEHRYGLVIPKRTDTNIRYYDDDDLCCFLNIAALAGNGYKISKIAQMERVRIAEVVTALRKESSNFDIQIQSLTNAMLQLDSRNINKVLDTCIARLGIDQAMEDVFFPFMRKVGAMWQVGAINPAHEHFATNLIRQKIVAAINALPDKENALSKKFMLFLPEDENHDTGLLMAQYVLKRAGHHVLYLGQNMPIDGLYETASYYKPNYILTAITSVYEIEAGKMVEKILQSLPDWPVLLSGALSTSKSILPHPRLNILNDFKDLTDLAFAKEGSSTLVSVTDFR